MTKLFYSIVCIVLMTGFGKAQVVSKDTMLKTVEVTNPCVFLTSANFRVEGPDKTFENFCVEVLTGGRYDITDSGNVVLKLLQSVKDIREEEFCFTPFLRLVDPGAKQKGDSLCIPHPWHSPRYYDGYCFRKTAAFIVLFYAEFVLLRKMKIDNRELVAELGLERKGNEKEKLSDKDLGMILDLYIDWFSKNGAGKRKGHPLKRTEYKWSFSTIYKGRSFIKGDD